MKSGFVKRSVLPGFGLTMGFTILYLSLIVLIPLSFTIFKTMELTWAEFIAEITTERVIESYKLSFGTSFFAALINAVFGVIVAWILTRYDFWGKRIVDGLVDLPFALPTAVAGISLATLYAPEGWIGKYFYDTWEIQISFTKWGVFVALIFIGLPFVVRTVQPVIESLEKEVEEAALSLGASRLQSFIRIIFPQLLPAILTGFAMAFARAIGEYGSVVFISGNIPLETEITPLLIMSKLEQFDYAGATALAVVMLVISFVLLLVINFLQWYSQRRG